MLTSIGAASLATVLAPTAYTQDLDLRRGGEVLPWELNSVGSLRALDDGRVLVVDKKDRLVYLLDPRTGAQQTIGRQGDGPSEYQRPSHVLAARGDTTILLDFLARRSFRVVGGTLQPGRTDSMLGAVGGGLCGMDRDGHILGTRPLGSRAGGAVGAAPPRTDSLVVMRYKLTASRLDTLMRLRNANGGTLFKVNWVNGRGQGGWVIEAPAAVEDQACVFPDGWIALLRQAPYSVEWLTPNGARAAFGTLSEEAIAMTQREQEYARERAMGTSASVRAIPTSEFPPWPDRAPPFVSAGRERRAVPTVDGLLLVPRWPRSDQRLWIYDVIGRDARRAGRIILGEQSRIIGSGPGVLYILDTDDDGLERIRRVRWRS
ncbi:MAG: hypothetical protein MUD17_04015 [Gemmatimonadaceae bacterium]|jgi:hypothetical protein|nr:hypothetical protein [Gemmatimonadaceae bacterium]